MNGKDYCTGFVEGGGRLQTFFNLGVRLSIVIKACAATPKPNAARRDKIFGSLNLNVSCQEIGSSPKVSRRQTTWRVRNERSNAVAIAFDFINLRAYGFRRSERRCGSDVLGNCRQLSDMLSSGKLGCADRLSCKFQSNFKAFRRDDFRRRDSEKLKLI